MTARVPLPAHALLGAAYAVIAVFAAAALMAAAVLAHAPVAVLPLLIALVIALPMIAALELPRTVALLRRGAQHGRELTRLRRELARLPETHHPLGL